MRVIDSLNAVFRKKENKPYIKLSTVWSEQADDEHEIPLPEYPRPQMRRKEWECLNGWWEYAVTGAEETAGGAGAFPAPDGRILVPFPLETDRSGAGKTLMPGEALWYRRTVDVPEIREGCRLLLHFGAVDERCSVWWNGKELGSHKGGYLPFTFDVTDSLRTGENYLTLRVLDDTDRGQACRGKQKLEPGGMFYSAQSGIWQTVWTEWVPCNYVREMEITPDPENSEVRIRLNMAGPADGTVQIGKPEIGNPEIGNPETGQKDPPDSPSHLYPIRKEDFDSQGWCTCRIAVENSSCWTPETPYLYPFTVCAGEDEVNGYFAMRSFGKGTDAAGRPCLTLNGQPYFFNGVLDQGYWPESLMTPPSDEAMIFDIEEMKDAGFNMLRKHIKVEPLRWYYHCDRLGMAVWQDMVNGGGPINAFLCTYLPTGIPAAGRHLKDSHYGLLSRKDEKGRADFEEQLMEMIRHLYNCPCIGLWVIFNEGWGQFDAGRLAESVRQADPTRMADHASGWFDQGAGDVRSVHNYFRELRTEKDPCGRPFVISEYGGYTCRVPGHVSTEKTSYGYRTEDQDTFPGAFRALMEKIRALSAEGLSGAVYTQVSDIQEELNGVLTFDRKVRKDRYQSSSGSNKVK